MAKYLNDTGLSYLWGKITDAIANSTKSFSGTITTTWSGAAAPFTQDVTVSGILSTDRPHVTPDYSSTLATASLEEAAFGLISKVDASAVDTLTFTCFGDKPTQAIPFVVEVNR